MKMKNQSNVLYIGEIRSGLTKIEQCPLQGHEGAPDARIEIYPPYRDAMKGITPGSRLIVLTWLNKADRNLLQVHPRHNTDNPLTGVFLTRSPNRPNPVGIHEVQVMGVDKSGMQVTPMEALNMTPVIDIKLSIPIRT